MAAGHYRRAEAHYGMCIAHGELEGAALASAQHRLGRSLMKQGRHEEALAALDAALDTDPTYHPAWNTRARIDLLDGRPEQALDDVRQALAYGGDDIRSLDTEAHILAALGRTDEAMAVFDRVLALCDPDGVRKFQQALADSGYDPGPVDGIAGPRTRTALAACVADACVIW